MHVYNIICATALIVEFAGESRILNYFENGYVTKNKWKKSKRNSEVKLCENVLV